MKLYIKYVAIYELHYFKIILLEKYIPNLLIIKKIEIVMITS
jgi:hypothetical protein